MVTRCMEGPNFYEGVRALLVDKVDIPFSSSLLSWLTSSCLKGQ